MENPTNRASSLNRSEQMLGLDGPTVLVAGPDGEIRSAQLYQAHEEQGYAQIIYKDGLDPKTGEQLYSTRVVDMSELSDERQADLAAEQLGGSVEHESSREITEDSARQVGRMGLELARDETVDLSAESEAETSDDSHAAGLAAIRQQIESINSGNAENHVIKLDYPDLAVEGKDVEINTTDAYDKRKRVIYEMLDSGTYQYAKQFAQQGEVVELEQVVDFVDRLNRLGDSFVELGREIGEADGDDSEPELQEAVRNSVYRMTSAITQTLDDIRTWRNRFGGGLDASAVNTMREIFDLYLQGTMQVERSLLEVAEARPV